MNLHGSNTAPALHLLRAAPSTPAAGALSYHQEAPGGVHTYCSAGATSTHSRAHRLCKLRRNAGWRRYLWRVPDRHRAAVRTPARHVVLELKCREWPLWLKTMQAQFRPYRLTSDRPRHQPRRSSQLGRRRPRSTFCSRTGLLHWHPPPTASAPARGSIPTQTDITAGT